MELLERTFIVPFSIYECSRRLELAKQLDIFGWSRADLRFLFTDVYARFEFQPSFGRGAIKINGHFEKLSDKNTKIHLTEGNSQSLFILAGSLAVLSLLIAALAASEDPLSAVFMSGGTCIWSLWLVVALIGWISHYHNLMKTFDKIEKVIKESR